MQTREVHLSAEFKRQTTRAIIAIVFFVIVYLLILAISIGLTIACLYAGFAIIIGLPSIFGIIIGVGIASVGILIQIFLLKFLFKSHKVDRSNLIEITRPEEPALFEMIDEIVEAVKTTKPKKVYITANVNAAVFYDSNFWSMFLPIRKNLMIGMGLVNTVTKSELKAVLSHEFGHFSQRTMKVGSYVYNVNQVIFNMLFDNESYGRTINSWASIHQYITFFVMIAVKIIEGIQWLLRKMYTVVNKSYMALSREMEFHADEIAASVTGYEPLKESLLRLSLANAAFDEVIDYYNNEIKNNVTTGNIYTNQTDAMRLLALLNDVPMKNQLPDVSMDDETRFNKSKLVIKDQWASHPTTIERIKRLESTGFSADAPDNSPAKLIFRDFEKAQAFLTVDLFKNVNYSGEKVILNADDFNAAYEKRINENRLPQIYNGYYDQKAPETFDLNIQIPENTPELEELFGDRMVDKINQYNALTGDLQTLKDIGNNFIRVKTYDYDGVRYKQKETAALIEKLNEQKAKLESEIFEHDKKIYAFFLKAENEKQLPGQLEKLYSDLFDYNKAFEARMNIFNILRDKIQFVHVTTPNDEITHRLARIRPMEDKLAAEIRVLLSLDIFKDTLSPEASEALNKYIRENWVYFDGTRYNESNLQILYGALNNYHHTLYKGTHLLKKKILTYQTTLIS